MYTYIHTYIRVIFQVVKTITSGKKTGGDFLSATVSRMGTWLYCLAEDMYMYVFSLKDGKLEHIVHVHEKVHISYVCMCVCICIMYMCMYIYLTES